MPATSQQTNPSALCSTLTCLLETISEKGYWQDPQESWEPILTCVAVEVLMDAGLTVDHCWVIRRAEHCRMVLETPLRWLNSRIQSDGRFGTDFWEACRLAMTIEKHKLHSYFPNYAELQKYILNAHASGSILSGDSDWVGPGFLAAAADYFDRIGRPADADALVTRLRSTQEADGRWYGSVAPTGHPIVSPVWHTSQVVLTLSRRNRIEHRDAITRALAWVRGAQDSSGKWPDIQQYVIYSTCYAILALCQAEVPDQSAIARGVEFLKGAMRPDGRFQDFGGTLMVALALLALVRQHIGSDLTTIDYVLARMAKTQMEAAEKMAAAAKAEAADFKARNEALEKKYHNADFGVTKKQLFVVGLIVAFVIPTMSAVANRLLAKFWPTKSSTDSQVVTPNPTAPLKESSGGKGP